jgi:hypothetical protein
MSIANPSTAPDMTSDSTFRTWGASIGNTMVALGLARASDTGQINWASVVRPGTTSTSAGFEMFVLTDTLQATYPVFIKMEYGTAGSTTLPMIWVTVGTGSNGAGTLTGVVGTRVFICPTTTSVTSYSSKWSGASNRIACLLWQGSWNPNYMCGFSVERTHDAAGADTGAGVLLFFLRQGSAALSYLLPFTGSIPAGQSQWNCAMPPSGSGAIGSDVYVYPVRAWGMGESVPSLTWMMYFSIDLTAYNPIPVIGWDGVSRTCYPLGWDLSPGTHYGGGGGTPNIMMRWD